MKELRDTVEQMTSDDYKERFKAEYEQTKIRYLKLASFIHHIEAYQEAASNYDMNQQGNHLEEPKHDCSLSLLKRQLRALDEYLNVLEVRAIIENIRLSD